MPTSISGKLDGKGKRFALVASRFNEFFTKQLVAGATDCLARHGVSDNDISVVWVPGAFEIPVAAKRLAASGNHDAVICLGAVVRGGTPHFELVSAEAAKGIARVAMDSDVPVVFGLVTTDTLEQAVERSGTKSGNRGFDAALSALEMVDLLQKL
jgi:6,7-dimethyl-8-ribityllumazine synthase